MSITEQGIEGEKLARLFIKKVGFNHLMQLDWVAERNGKYFQFEIKCKELFQPPPFLGHGLNKYQAERRMAFQQKTGIRCGFIVFDIDPHTKQQNGKVYYQWLDELYHGEQFETKNGILLFPLKNFKEFQCK